MSDGLFIIIRLFMIANKPGLQGVTWLEDKTSVLGLPSRAEFGSYSQQHKMLLMSGQGGGRRDLTQCTKGRSHIHLALCPISTRSHCFFQEQVGGKRLFLPGVKR